MKNLTKIQKLTIIFVLLAAVLSSCGEEEVNPLDPEEAGVTIPNVTGIEAKPQKIDGKSRITLTWKPIENPKVYESCGYKISRDGESYVSVGKSVKSYTDKNVKEGQEYTYKIVIKYRIGDSPVGIGSLKSATSVKARAPGELKSIEIIPPSGQIVVGESGYEFSAQAHDDYGNKWSINPKWDVEIEKGEITEDGHFTPKKPGELTVKASYKEKQVPCTFTVEPGTGVPTRLVPIEPALSAEVCSEIVLRARLSDANDNPSKGFTVSFGIVRTPPNLQVKEQLVPSDGKSITDENGIAKITLKLGSKAEGSGYEIQANYSGQKELKANFVVTATSGKPYEIQKHKGDNQSGSVGKKAENELSVKIVDKYDNPTEGVEVRWHFDGVPKDTKNHKLEPNLSVSDKYGIASTSLTYGTRTGNYIVSAYKQGLNGSPVVFSDLKADHSVPDKLIRVSSGGMKGTVGTVTEPLVVKLVDEFENPVEGKTIDFTLDQNRSISIDGEIKDSKTDADGKASSPFKIGKTEGKYYVNAKWSNLPKVTFEIEALADRESAELFKITKEGQRGYPNTDMKESLVVEVKDQYGNLIENISASFKIVKHPSSASGMSVTPATVSTDNNGRAEAKMHLGDKVGDYVVKVGLTDYPEKFVKFTATAIPPTTGDVTPKQLHFEKDEKVKELEIVREQGDERIEWQIVSKSNWIVPEKNSDSFSGDSQKIDIAVNRANLPIGSEEDEIELKINNKEFSVRVTADVAFTSRITVINPLDLEPVESATILWNGKNLMSDHSGQVELVITEQIEKISATVSKEGYLDTEFDTPLKEEILIELKPIPQLIDEISNNAEFGELSQAAFSSDCSRLYVTDKEVESPQLFCINTSDNQITGSYDFPSGSDPVGVAVNPVTDEVYVALSGGLTREDSVFILNPNLEKVAEITVGNGPVDLAVTPDGKFLYVLNQIEETVSEVDIERRVEITPRIKVGGQPQDIVIDEQGISAYVTNADDSSVSVVDLKFRQVDTVPVGSEPHGMAFSENGEFLYTANYDGDSVSVIDTNSNMRVEDISVGNLPIDSCLSCLDLLFVANYIDGTVSIIDLESGKVADEMIELGYVNQAIVSTKDGRKIYVVHPNAVSVLGY